MRVFDTPGRGRYARAEGWSTKRGAEVEVQVRVTNDALDVLGQIRPLTSPRSPVPGSNATSALLVELRREATGKKQQQALMSRILGR